MRPSFEAGISISIVSPSAMPGWRRCARASEMKPVPVSSLETTIVS